MAHQCTPPAALAAGSPDFNCAHALKRALTPPWHCSDPDGTLPACLLLDPQSHDHTCRVEGCIPAGVSVHLR